MQQHGASFRTSNIRQFASGYFPMRSGVNPKRVLFKLPKRGMTVM